MIKQIDTEILAILFLIFTFGAGDCAIAQTIKEPAVAGDFYPADANKLSQQINDFLNKADPQEPDGKIVGLISPHAGYVYSGGVAAYGYKLLKGKKFDTVIVVGPSHYVYFEGISVWAKGKFKTPIGQIPIDEALAQEIINENPDRIKFYSRAFENEHSIETQLPFLQETLGDFKLVPILISKPTMDNAKVLADAITKSCKDKNVLIVASTDLSHFHDYKTAVDMDKQTLDYLFNLDALNLFNKCAAAKAEACGLGPLLTILLFAQENNLSLKVLKYANSGDVTFDFSRVVGYTSAVIYKGEDNMEETEMLNDAQKKRLLEIARRSLESYIVFGKREEFTENDPVLIEKCGAFVTLNKNEQLRGCIGHIIGDLALYKTVADMAIEAGVGDPRFPNVTVEELNDIEIEISLLSPLELITDVNKIEVGKHGILMRRGFNSGLLLPQVAVEYGWDRQTFLAQTCHKAGLPADAWKDSSTQIYIFSAVIFSEEKHK